MIDLSDSNIKKTAISTGFIKDSVEKVMRLIDVLEDIFSSNLKTKFALKGGTAINAFYANLPRLSVDIDIDYLGSSREEMIRDKHTIDEYLQMALFQKGYSLSPNTRQYFALNSYMFQYTNSSGNKDVIKIDMNFLDRLHIFPLQERKISILGYQGEVPVTILDRRELYGSKLAALISRCKPRDVYDIYMLSQSKEPIDGESLRKTLIFYNCVGGDADVLNYDGKILSKLSRRLDIKAKW